MASKHVRDGNGNADQHPEMAFLNTCWDGFNQQQPLASAGEVVERPEPSCITG